MTALNYRIAMAGMIAALMFVASQRAEAVILLHSSLDNADVGAGAGTDTTASAYFRSGATRQFNQALSFPSSDVSNRAVTYGDILLFPPYQRQVDLPQQAAELDFDVPEIQSGKP